MKRWLRWRRMVAYQEAHALRMLLRAHGRFPRVVPTKDWQR